MRLTRYSMADGNATSFRNLERRSCYEPSDAEQDQTQVQLSDGPLPVPRAG